MMAAACAGQIAPSTHRALEEYADAIGLAFQIQDDLLDVEGDPNVIGKATGADQALNKPTYPSVAGVEVSRRRMHELGLRGMPERAALIGGKLAVWSEVGGGTEIELRVPASAVYLTAWQRSGLSRLLPSSRSHAAGGDA